MLIDDIDDGLRQMLLLGDLNTVLGVSSNDRNALHDRQIVVRIYSAVLVLGKVLRILELSDVIVDIVETGTTLKENNLEDKVELGGTFCLGQCQQGVCVTVDDNFFSVTPDNVVEFFSENVLAKV